MSAPTLYAYRLVVDSWPTDDGQPWARFYGANAAAPNDEIPGWLDKIVTDALAQQRRPSWRRSPMQRVRDRVRLDDNDDVIGVVMPKPHRRNYLAASGAHELARDMRAFGAVVTVQRSAAIAEWIDLEVSQ